MRLADVDFLRQPGQPIAAWWVLAAGTLCLAASIALSHHWRMERDAASSRERAALNAHQARLQPVAAVQPTPAQRRWNQARPELAKPWLAALSAIESATHAPVYLLSMNIDPATGLIRLEGEAPGFDQAVAYVQALGAEPALSSATLESHSEVSSAGISAAAAALSPPTTLGALPSDKPVVRFSALTHWREP